MNYNMSIPKLFYIILTLFVFSCSNNDALMDSKDFDIKQIRDGKITIADINNDKVPDLIVSGYQRGGKTDLKKALFIEYNLKKIESDTGKWEGKGYTFYIDKDYKLWVKTEGKREKQRGNIFKSSVDALVTENGNLEITYNDKKINVKKNQWEIPALKIWVDVNKKLWIKEDDTKIIARFGKWKRKFNVVINHHGEFIKGTGYKRGGKLDSDRIPIGDSVVAIDGRDQKILWSFQTQNSVENYPSYFNGKIYIGSKDRSFYALDAKTGKLTWKLITEAPINTTAVTTKNKIYFANQAGRLYALSTERGHVLWAFTANAGIESSPALYENKLYFGSWDKKMYCLNADTGKIIWTQKLPSYIGKSSPIVYNEKVIIGSWDKNIYAFDVNSGKAEWIFQTNDWIDKGSPAAGNGLIYIGNKSGVLYAIHSETGVMKWQFNTGDAITSSPVVTKNRVYLTSRDGYIYALNPSNGKLIWERKMRFKIFGSPAVADNKVFYSSLAGRVLSITDNGMGKPYWAMFGGEPEHKHDYATALIYSKKLAGKKTFLEKFLEDNNFKSKD